MGLDIAAGSMVGGFEKLEKFLRPVYELIAKKNAKEKQWNADETRWSVFEPIEGKGNYRWYLWVFKAVKTVVFLLDPSRATRVIQGHLGNDAKGILACDRYSAYKCFARIVGSNIILAFCWAHVRRDFLDLGKKHPEHQVWSEEWVDLIAELYHLNDLRIQYEKKSQDFAIANKALKEGLKNFKKRMNSEKKAFADSDPRYAVLTSLSNHWAGLSVFVKHPEIPMDNNPAERIIRGPVVGRKNYYGSGSIQAAHFAAMMFTIIQTLLINKINPRKWLTWFFNECALQGDEILSKSSRFLPWNLSADEYTDLSLNPEDLEPLDSS